MPVYRRHIDRATSTLVESICLWLAFQAIGDTLSAYLNASASCLRASSLASDSFLNASSLASDSFLNASSLASDSFLNASNSWLRASSLASDSFLSFSACEPPPLPRTPSCPSRLASLLPCLGLLDQPLHSTVHQSHRIDASAPLHLTWQQGFLAARCVYASLQATHR